MKLAGPSGTISTISAQELRELIDTRRSEEYLLVDVRQPEEYAKHHIPGAQLIPLFDLDAHLDDLVAAREPVIIFYCRSGARSIRAAELASAHGVPHVANLVGGILAWQGERLPSMPNLRVFADTESLGDLLIAALDLEKGAHRLYEALYQHFAGTSIDNVLKRLTWVEVGHERVVYQLLVEYSDSPVPPFTELMAKLRGDVLESGDPIDEVLDCARSLAVFGAAAVLELALELELRAYDMYRALAHQATNDKFRDAFLTLANQENAHARHVLEALVKVTEDNSSWVD